MLSTTVSAASPIEGTWYNSFCSRVDLSVADNGQIKGVYTSHTGSTGSSMALGQLDSSTSSSAEAGIPFSMGIQWRLINVEQSQADGSWHWVSMFSGQYHPAQQISVPGQDPYSIPETLEILNLLIATATLPGLADMAPITWPQTLDFHRSAPEYCHTVSPGQPVPYTPTASDNVSGVWLSTTGERLDLKAEIATGEVIGTYSNGDGTSFNVVGLFDTLAAPSSGNYSVGWQGLTLSLLQADPESEKLLRALSGGVDYRDTSKMHLWSSAMQSTSWTDRFVQQSLQMATFTKQ